LPFLYFSDREKYYIRTDELIGSCYELYRFAKDFLKTTPATELVRKSSAFVTETILLHKTCKLVQSIAQNLQPTLEALEHSIEAEESMVAIGLEDLKFKQIILFEKELVKNPHPKIATPSAVEVITTACQETAPVANMYEFFEQREFGKLLKNHCRKTKMRFQGQSVYEVVGDIENCSIKSGEFFYLDNLHKNHLEVFEGCGKIKKQSTIINLDGSIHSKKAAKNNTKNRRITL
jgi:hypothetical protein